MLAIEVRKGGEVGLSGASASFVASLLKASRSVIDIVADAFLPTGVWVPPWVDGEAEPCIANEMLPAFDLCLRP